MLSHLSKYLERLVIAVVATVLISTSVLSWSQLLQTEPSAGAIVVDANQATKKIKSGILVFAGLMILVSDFLELQDEE